MLSARSASGNAATSSASSAGRPASASAALPLLPRGRLARGEEVARGVAQAGEAGAPARERRLVERVEAGGEQVARHVRDRGRELEERGVGGLARQRARAAASRTRSRMAGASRTASASSAAATALRDRQAAPRDEARDQRDAVRVDEAVRRDERGDLAPQAMAGDGVGPGLAPARREVRFEERAERRPVEERIAVQRAARVELREPDQHRELRAARAPGRARAARPAWRRPAARAPRAGCRCSRRALRPPRGTPADPPSRAARRARGRATASGCARARSRRRRPPRRRARRGAPPA